MRERKPSLSKRVADKLSTSIATGEFKPGERLPTEFELAEKLGVSRTTVRAAINEMAALGLVHTTHGVGTFVIDRPIVQAGLENLDSITDSIRAGGRTPGMNYVARIKRPILPDEAKTMEMDVDTEVLELRRTIYADNEVMAFSYDLMPTSFLPKDFDVESLDGSLFAAMQEDIGVIPHHSVAHIHAVHSEHVGWGPEAKNHNLFVLLNQRHFDASNMLLLYSRTYFIEGRYEFTMYRARLP